jgi:hypothetical protein
MEGPQAGCYEVHQWVYDLSAEQVRAYISSGTNLATSHSGVEMREHIDGLYHRTTQGSG